MNKIARWMTVAAVSSMAALGAHAAEMNPGQFAQQQQSSLSRAQVHAEAVQYAKNRSTEPAGSRVQAVTSTADRAQVRAAAVQALRQGEISSGE